MTSANLRVLQILPSLVPGGGSEQSLAMVDPLIVDRGIDVHLAFLNQGSGLVNDLRSAGVTVHDLSFGDDSTFARVRRLRSLIRWTRPAVAHSTLFDADMWTRMAAPFGDPVLLSTWANTSYDPVRKQLEPGYGGWKREAVRWIDLVSAHLTRSRFHALTDGVAADGIRGLHVRRDRVWIVERGRDLSTFRPSTPDRRKEARSRMAVGADDQVLLHVGRQFHQKGHVHLIRAFGLLADRYQRLRLVLVGPDGPATPAVRAAIDACHVRDRIVELGQRTDVAELLPGADVFVLSSVAEGAAGSVLEAMVSAVPVVATRIAGLRGWVVDGQDALLAEPGDESDLARTIAQVLDEPQEAAKRADRARAEAIERFSIERCADDMVRMYSAVRGC